MRSGWGGRLRENWVIFRQNLLGKLGMILLVCFGLMAITSFIPPLIDPMYDPMTGVDPEIISSTGPSARHWLGTDFMGRDILSQLLAGARVAFMVGVSAAFMSIFLGTAIGMVAGYAGRFIDTLLMRAADIIMVMPTLLVVLILSSLFGQLNIWTIVLIIALFRWPGVSRVIRAQTLSLKNRPYIEAARVAVTRHVKRGGKIWIRIFPDKPISKKPAETRMGKGKGAPEAWVAVVKPGRILYELEGVAENVAGEAFRLAGFKLPFATRFVSRRS